MYRFKRPGGLGRFARNARLPGFLRARRSVGRMRAQSSVTDGGARPPACVVSLDPPLPVQSKTHQRRLARAARSHSHSTTSETGARLVRRRRRRRRRRQGAAALRAAAVAAADHALHQRVPGPGYSPRLCVCVRRKGERGKEAARERERERERERDLHSRTLGGLQPFNLLYISYNLLYISRIYLSYIYIGMS